MTAATVSKQDRVILVIAEFLELAPEAINVSQHLANDLGCDSLDLVELCMAMEEEFEIEITDEDADPIKTVQQIVDYIAKATA